LIDSLTKNHKDFLDTPRLVCIIFYMGRNIKQVRPNKRYKAGCINPASCKKLFESQKHNPIIYRSSYEKDFVYWLERSKKVLHWGSECVGIPYINMFDGSHHTYYPDYVVEMQTPEGQPYLVFVEVKPYNQTIPPDNNLPRDSYAWREYIKNRSKWKAAKEFCERNGATFHIITERTIQRLG